MTHAQQQPGYVSNILQSPPQDRWVPDRDRPGNMSRASQAPAAAIRAADVPSVSAFLPYNGAASPRAAAEHGCTALSVRALERRLSEALAVQERCRTANVWPWN